MYLAHKSETLSLSLWLSLILSSLSLSLTHLGFMKSAPDRAPLGEKAQLSPTQLTLTPKMRNK